MSAGACGALAALILQPHGLSLGLASVRTVAPRCAAVALDDAPGSSLARDACAADSEALLDSLDRWLRRQSIRSVLPPSQARHLLRDLRDDHRFWAQQRRQFARAWNLVEAGLRQETRPVGELLGNETASKVLSYSEDMDVDPAIVNALIRSEVVEAMLGHVLYDGAAPPPPLPPPQPALARAPPSPQRRPPASEMPPLLVVTDVQASASF